MTEGVKYMLETSQVILAFDTLDECLEHSKKYHLFKIYSLTTKRIA